jgi:hypothetical protein
LAYSSPSLYLVKQIYLVRIKTLNTVRKSKSTSMRLLVIGLGSGIVKLGAHLSSTFLDWGNELFGEGKDFV